MSSILLYVGTVLIAFQLVGDLSHLFALLLHSIGRLVAAIGSPRKERVTRGRSAFLNALKNIPRQVLLLLLLIVVFAITIVMFAVWIVGQFLLYINARLNSAYLGGLDPRKMNYIPISRAFAAMMGKDNPDISDLAIWEKIKQRGFPFIGLIGIIILTTGFALQLLGR
jgi:hypothetical protein